MAGPRTGATSSGPQAVAAPSGPPALAGVLQRLLKYWPRAPVSLLQRAHAFAARAHEGQKRLTGEPYLIHCVATADHLCTIEADPDSIAAGFLHDTIEDCGVTREQLTEEFGAEIAELVWGVTKLTRIDFSTRVDKQAENLRRMFMAMARDLRVIVIKLCDRLHNMQTLGVHEAGKRRETAQETQQIFAPLADRLGMWSIKWQLEDLALRYLEPEAYEDIAGRVAAARPEREARVEALKEELARRLKAVRIKAAVQGRAKHFYSIHQKMRREQIDYDQIADLNALRVLVKADADCYAALGVVHSLWTPMREKFTDYIATPKSNQYQSLHTKVWTPEHDIVEVQIRTHEMHRRCEYGIASHWRYKQGATDGDSRVFDEKISVLRQVLELETEFGDQHEFLENVVEALFEDQVFVLTPDGDVMDLPRGATPIDFAYRVHTEVGNRCAGARVNGDQVSLQYELQNGDICEIVTLASARPNADWLRLVASPHARQKIRRFLRQQTREENVQLGRERFEREVQRLGAVRRERLDLGQLDSVATGLNLKTEEDLFAAIGYADVEPDTVIQRLEQHHRRPASVEEEAQLLLPTEARPEETPKAPVATVGGADVLTRLSKCCQPLPGDDIIGYVTRGTGLAVHRVDCKNVQYHIRREPNRAVDVTWSADGDTKLRARVELTALDRVGLLSHITAIIAEDGINIAGADVSTEKRPGLAALRLTLEVESRERLEQMIRRLEGLQDVLQVRKL